MDRIEEARFRELLLAGTPWIDVRAEEEFQQGHIPGAVNLPILRNEERARVGTTYKQQGPEAAIRLGHELVSGAVKEARVQAWRERLRLQPESVIYCFRGGLRSQITQAWLKEVGIERPLVSGGYKKLRQFLLRQLAEIPARHPLVLVSGPTGSGKTDLLKELASSEVVIDLEELARHRGSAFGSRGEQPGQVLFENHLAVELMRSEERLEQRPGGAALLLEDESRLLGRRALPESLFAEMRKAPVVWVQEDLEARVGRIFQDYIRETPLGLVAQGGFRCAEERGILFEEARQVLRRYQVALAAIQRKLGGLRYAELSEDLARAESAFVERGDLEPNKEWIRKLLVYYYDPLYLGSLERREVHKAFVGSYKECREFLRAYHARC